LAAGKEYLSVLFDLDGTLTNPKTGITRAVQYALNKHGIEVGNIDDLQVYIGPPLRQAFMEHHHLSEAKAEQALAFYREYYERAGMLENMEYPGIAELLKGLKQKRKRLFVATSKPRFYAEKIALHFNLDQFFESIEGSELDGKRSDKAELIGYVIEKHQLEKRSTVMVGDRMHDIIGALKSGIDSIGVGYGFGSREELENAHATYYVETVEGLSEFFRYR
jgi:phosphoglycolate phosphatase